MTKIGDQYLTTPLTGFNPAMTAIPLPPPPANANANPGHVQPRDHRAGDHRLRVPLEMHLPLALRRATRACSWVSARASCSWVVPDGQSTPDEMQALRARVDEMGLAMTKAVDAAAKK